MTTCLVLGSARCLQQDIDFATSLGEYDMVVACKWAGVLWPGHLDAWVSLHPEMWDEQLKARRDKGYSPASRLYSHNPVPAHGVIGTDYKFPKQIRSGSSGLFAVKVALIDLQVDKAVLCGIPLDRTKGKINSKEPIWPGGSSFFQGFEEALPHLRDRVRSASGWTANLLGRPTAEWLTG